MRGGQGYLFIEKLRDTIRAKEGIRTWHRVTTQQFTVLKGKQCNNVLWHFPVFTSPLLFPMSNVSVHTLQHVGESEKCWIAAKRPTFLSGLRH